MLRAEWSRRRQTGPRRADVCPAAPPSASCAAWVSARLVSRYSWTVELSQLAKSAMKSSSAFAQLRPGRRTGPSFCLRRLESRAAFRAEQLLPLVRSPGEHFAASPPRGTPAGIARPPGQATVPRKSPPGTPPAAAAPTKYAAWKLPMPNGLLAPRMGGDAADGEINFDEAFGVSGHVDGSSRSRNSFWREERRRFHCVLPPPLWRG